MMKQPYQLTDEEMFHHNGDVDAIIKERFKYQSGISYEHPSPQKVEWSIRSKHWGKVWAEVAEVEPRHHNFGITGPFMVIANIGGCMTGIPVAVGFQNRDFAKAFAKDFEKGMVFITFIVGAEIWEDFVNYAHNLKAFDSGTKSALLNMARDYGLLPSGYTLDRKGLYFVYENGERIADLIKGAL